MTRTSTSTRWSRRSAPSLAERVRDATLRIYRFAADFAAERGILLADTKFEFGTDADGRLYIMDEMLTPDSSRYWPADQYSGHQPAELRQAVRARLSGDAGLGQDRTGPEPAGRSDRAYACEICRGVAEVGGYFGRLMFKAPVPRL